MAVVAGGMMMVVGDSAARAFGIFAAASLVRFRTNIRDPKETTVLLVCLGVGLAAGVGRWDMAVILTLFVLIALSVLEFWEPFQLFRSMEFSGTTRNVDRTDGKLRQSKYEQLGDVAQLAQFPSNVHVAHIMREKESPAKAQKETYGSLGASSGLPLILVSP